MPAQVVFMAFISLRKDRKISNVPLFFFFYSPKFHFHLLKVWAIKAGACFKVGDEKINKNKKQQTSVIKLRCDPSKVTKVAINPRRFEGGDVRADLWRELLGLIINLLTFPIL